MKELSIEEKAKRYDEAVEKARNIVNSINVGLIGKDSFEAVFPELREESEDERIRKELIAFLKENHETGRADETWSLSGIERWIAWLEKQGEQKPAEVRTTGYWNVQDIEQTPTDKVEPKFKVGDKIKLAREPKYPAREIIAIQDDAYYFDEVVYLPFGRQDEWELVEQKPAWSEEDNIILSRIIADYERSNEEWFNAQKSLPHGRKINWLKSLKDRVQPKQDSSLTEIDEHIINTLIHHYEQINPTSSYFKKVSKEVFLDRMHSFKYRNRWKPTEKQLDALHDAAAYVDKSMFPYPKGILMKLYKQIKKLREE